MVYLILEFNLQLRERKSFRKSDLEDIITPWSTANLFNRILWRCIRAVGKPENCLTDNFCSQTSMCAKWRWRYIEEWLYKTVFFCYVTGTTGMTVQDCVLLLRHRNNSQMPGLGQPNMNSERLHEFRITNQSCNTLAFLLNVRGEVHHRTRYEGPQVE